MSAALISAAIVLSLCTLGLLMIVSGRCEQDTPPVGRVDSPPHDPVV